MSGRRIRCIVPASGAKRSSWEYSFAGDEKEWHMVYGKCPGEWVN